MSEKHINAKDLCEYALAAVGGGYVYGSSGQRCSLRLRESCAAANPSQRENILGICRKWDGKNVWDCSGLFRGAWRALWNYRSGGATGIWNTWCTGEKGEMGTMPDRPGIALFVQSGTGSKGMSHIGLYVGGGMVVDARGSREGVLHRPLGDHKWTHWAELDEVDYTNSLPRPEEVPALWVGIVKTRTGGGISLWKDSSKGVAVLARRIPDGACVDVLSEADGRGFVQARYLGKAGVVDAQYVRPVEGEAQPEESYMARVIGVKIGLNLRTEPRDARNTVLLMPPGARVEVLSGRERDGFAYVVFEGRAGYCTAAKLERAEDEVA